MTRNVELRAAKIPGIGLIADHYWFVITKQDKQDRWEVWQNKNAGGISWTHIHQNLKPPCDGVGNGPSWLVHRWEGDKAEKLILTIENTPKCYPYRDHYFYWPGPNSNTYVQWILHQTGIDFSLGSTAIGKDYLGIIGSHQGANSYQVSTPVLGFKWQPSKSFEAQLLSFCFGLRLKPLRCIYPGQRQSQANKKEHL